MIIDAQASSFSTTIRSIRREKQPVDIERLFNLYLVWLKSFYKWVDVEPTLKNLVAAKQIKQKIELEIEQLESDDVHVRSDDFLLYLYGSLSQAGGRDQAIYGYTLQHYFQPLHQQAEINYDCPHCQARVLFVFLRRCVQQRILNDPIHASKWWQHQEPQVVVLLSVHAITKIDAVLDFHDNDKVECVINRELEQALFNLGDNCYIILVMKNFDNEKLIHKDFLPTLLGKETGTNRRKLCLPIKDIVTPCSLLYLPKNHINQCGAFYAETTMEKCGYTKESVLRNLELNQLSSYERESSLLLRLVHYINCHFLFQPTRYIWIDDDYHTFPIAVEAGRQCGRSITPIQASLELHKNAALYQQNISVAMRGLPSWLVKDHVLVQADKPLSPGHHTYLVAKGTTRDKSKEKLWFHKGEVDTRQSNSRFKMGLVINEEVLGCSRHYLELLFYSLYRMLLPQGACPYRTKLTTQDGKITGLLSREIPEFRSFTQLAGNKTFWAELDASGFMLRLIPILVTSYCLGEPDLNCENIGFDEKNRVCRIDFEPSVILNQFYWKVNWLPERFSWFWRGVSAQAGKTLQQIHKEHRDIMIKLRQLAAVGVFGHIKNSMGFWISVTKGNTMPMPKEFIRYFDNISEAEYNYMWRYILKYLLLTPDMFQYIVQLLIPTALAQSNIFTELQFQYELIKEVFMPKLQVLGVGQLRGFLGTPDQQRTILWEFAQYNQDPSINRHPQLQIPLDRIQQNFHKLFLQPAAAGCPPL